MIADTSSQTVKETDSVIQRFNQGCKGRDLDRCGIAETLEVFGKILVIDAHRAIGAKGRQDTSLERGAGERRVIGQIICRVVGGAGDFDLGLFEKAPCVHRFKSRICGVPQRRRVGLVDHGINLKKTLQFKMAPVMNRVADRLRKYAAKRQELFTIICVACDKPFGDARHSHQAPLVVIRAQP